MSRIVFWDTSAIVALGNSRDQFHQRAVIVSESLANIKAQTITTSAVLTEVANHFSAVRLRSIGENIVEALWASAENGELTIVHVSPDLWKQGWQLYKARPDKEWGLTDCISMVVMKNHGIEEAFTADHHFAQAGFTCLLTK